MLKEEKIREKIKSFEVTKLAESVQKFYNEPCARIEIRSKRNIEEVINLLIEIQR